MATLTREEVVNRAWNAFQDGGYFWGGDYRISTLRVKYVGASSTYINPYGNNEPYYPVVPDSSSNIIGVDCSGFCGWAWGLSYKHGSGAWSPSGAFSSRYRARSGNTHTHADFNGIQAGDVLWRSGHVALYIGGDMVLEFTTKNWGSTGNQRGGWHRSILQSEPINAFKGYCSFDNTWSSEYDPDAGEEPDWFTPSGGGSNSDLNGVTDGSPNNVDTSSTFYNYAAISRRYTKKYVLRKNARRR